MSKGPIIGIDFGTTYSRVGVWQNDHVEIIENNLGKRKTSSYVAFDENERLIGDTALYKAGTNPENTIYGVKRLMGLNFKDNKVQSDLKNWTFKVIENYKDSNIQVEKPSIQVEYKNSVYEFIPEDISSMIISKMKETAEEHLGQSVTDAVITVPANFNNSQRIAVRDAGIIAGLNVLKIINEPTAAALSYCFNNKTEKENVLIADLGGGTFDVSILTIHNYNIEVRATEGDTHLGGEDFTNRLVNYCVKEFKKEYDKDLSTNLKSISRLRIACEKAKKVLSSFDEALIDIECIFEDIDFNSKITRSCFEELNSDLFDKISSIIDIVIKNSKLTKTDINEIILVGSSTYIPKVQEIFSSYFGGKKINKTVDINEAVTYGATLQAAILSGKDYGNIGKFNIRDIIPFSLSIYNINKGTKDNIIESNTIIPVNKTKSFYIQDENYYYNNDNNIIIKPLNKLKRFISFKIYETNHYLESNIIEKHDLDCTVNSSNKKLKINVEFIVDINGILSINIDNNKSNKYCFNSWYVESYGGRLFNDQIYYFIEKANLFKEEDRKEKEREESMDNLEKYAYDILSTCDIAFKYIENLKCRCNDTIEYIKNNQNADINEYEKIKNELKYFSIPLLYMNKFIKKEEIKEL